MRRSLQLRTPTGLPDSVQHRLNMYALAASAAGVSALALAQPAEAKIVYTRAHIVLPGQSNSWCYLDLNHDGVMDFKFSHGYFYSTELDEFGTLVSMAPYKRNGNGVMGVNGSASALRAGVKVGPSGRFYRFGRMAFGVGHIQTQSRTHFSGAWANSGNGLDNRYVGLQFAIKGKAHYGWARVSVSAFRFTATLTGYAYETIPNKAIITGKTKGPGVIHVEPGSLGRLAQGSAGLAAWRRGEPTGSMH